MDAGTVSIKYTTVRVKLTCAEDYGSQVRRADLETALVELLNTSGVTFTFDGFAYVLSDATVVGR